MGMSYKRAWYLIDTMNVYFQEPMVVSVKGGNTRGGASLTATGLTVLNRYRRMVEKTRRAIDRELVKLASLARKTRR
jgi:molybdate transport system regulatory protein